MPSFTPDVLRAATSTAPPDPIYLELPSDFPSSVRNTAVTVTAGAATTYDAMVAMQNWFRTQFTYSLDVPQGHGNNAIEAFLRQRIGYCEQFAGTFAAMARSIGVPARVAVGFTQGVQQADGSFSVLGKNAHAWPEVWFDGLGWVAFEPTPGAGRPAPRATPACPPSRTRPRRRRGAGDGAGEEAAPVVTAPIPIEEEVPLPAPGAPGRRGRRAHGPSRDPRVRRARGASSGWSCWRSPSSCCCPSWSAAGGVATRSPDVARQTSDLWNRAIGAVAATGYRVDPALTPSSRPRPSPPACRWPPDR